MIFSGSMHVRVNNCSIYLRDRVGSNLVARGIEILDLAVVGPLVGHVERGRDGTSVGVLPSLLEQVGVETLVQVVHGIVKGQEDNLRYFFRQVVTCFVSGLHSGSEKTKHGGDEGEEIGTRVRDVCCV